MKKIYISTLLGLFHFFVSAQTEFITTWKTDNPGTSNDNQITIPTFPGETYDFTVDWGDGTSDTNVTGDITHTYLVAGVYTVSITGMYPQSYFAPLETIEDDAEKLLTIEQWGSQQWKSMWSAFASCKNLDVVATDVPNLSLVENAGEMFRFCSSLIGNSSFENWDLSNVKATFNMFDGATLFNQDIGNWDMGNNVNTQTMFQNAEAFNQDISGWNVEKVTAMLLMFSGATSFDQPLGDWDVSNVTTMIDMFQGASLSQSNYDQTLNGWASLPSLQNGVQFNAGNSTYCNGEISRNKLIKEHGWTISDSGKDCPFVTTWKTDNPGFSASNQILLQTYFGESYNYTVDWGDGSSDTNVTGDITHTYAVPGIYQVSISGDFPRISSGEDKDKLLRVDQWGSIVWTSMEYAFARCSNLAIAANDVPNLSNVTSLAGMFFYSNYAFDNTGTREYANLNGNENFNAWDVSTITDMANMFDKSSFNQDISSWDVSQVQNMSFMFYSASFNNPIGSWDVSNVENMEGLFGSSMFNQDISNWDVGSVANLNLIFNSTYFNHDISGWNVENVVSMHHAFSQGHFDQDLSSWDVSNVTDMSNAFDDSDLSRENYDAILAAWAQLPGLKNGVVLGANDAVYCLSEVDRNSLINDHGWIINDYGKDCDPEEPFITTWKTDNPGPSNDNQITIPTNDREIYDYRVDWGDGSFDEGVTGDITHTYAQPGVYQVSITGKFPRIYFNGSAVSYEFAPKNSDDLKLLSVDQWGSNRWKTMSFAFAGCENMNMKATDIPDFSRGISMNGMFLECSSLIGNESISNWDTQGITSMFLMFKDAINFNIPIGTWDMSGMRYMDWAFENATSFDQDLSGWDVSNVDLMMDIFKGSGLSNANYNNILIGWSQLPSLKNGVQLGAPDNYYCSAAEARQLLIYTYSWVINDAGPNGECNFVTTWKTDNPGTSADNQITIPTFPGETYDYTVDWGDGNSNTNVTGDIIHTYATPGTYQVSISGSFPRIFFVDGDKDFEKLIAVNNWGNIPWTSMAGAFAGCANLDVLATDSPDLSNVQSMQSMFMGCSNLVGNAGFASWDVGNVTDMFGVFMNAPLFNQNIGSWNVASVTDMGAMFLEATSFNQDISSWDVSNVVRMVNMFSGAGSFNQNIGGWDVSSVDDMAYMFRAANSFDQNIGSWNVSSVQRMEGMFMANKAFNQDISSWDVYNVTGMGVMFLGAELFNQDISAWDVSNVTDMDSMFQEALSFDQNLGGWNVSNVTNMSWMFWNVPMSTNNYDAILKGWSSLPNLQSNVEFNANLSQYCSASADRQFIIDTYGWTITDAGANTECLFVTTWKTDNPGATSSDRIRIPTYEYETYNYTVDWGDGTMDTGVTGDITHQYAIPGTYTVMISGDFPRIYFNDFDGNTQDSDKILSVDNWGDIKWISMDNAFTHCSNLDILATDVPNLADVTSLLAMFRFCESLVGNDSFVDWKVGSITHFSNMFDGASKFNQDISSWNVSKAVYTDYMFSDAKEFNIDISNWDISSLKYMWGMFSGASSFNQPIGKWKVHNIDSMQALFAGASAFNQDISSWDVSNVLNMVAMFSGASSFNQDISNWNVGNVTNMNVMFANTESFNQPIGKWNVSSVEDLRGMFDGAISFNQPLNEWDVPNVTECYTMFANATSFNQPLSNWDLSKVTDMRGMFANATSFNQDLSDWNMSNVTSIGGMFNGATSFNQSLGAWDVSNVINMDYLLSRTAITLENYDDTLIGWGNLDSFQNNVTLNAGGVQYCESTEVRQNLIDNYGWVITDGGQVPLCGQDNDADGVLDHMDLCLNSQPGVVVDEYGCEILPVDAIKVYALTPSCNGSSDGKIVFLMDTKELLFNISIVGESYSNQYNNMSGDEFRINNLSAGLYTITVSIPEILFEQVYGVTVNDLESLTGKRTGMDPKEGTVVYEVSGSKNYQVNINGEKRSYTFNSTGQQTIALENLYGQTQITISGESDCQGTIADSFFIGDTIQVYPTITASNVNFLTGESSLKVNVFGLDGRLVKQLFYDQQQKMLDVSTLKSGVYILQLEMSGRMETVKIVKR
ncbi:BspA family leucine-rich repeat surface protein [Allomuricauda sp. M10]|uniref:BspA family leucine-rich repeat surface protein n=1 Tax=Allomuricauda sp. M10 TaxID=2683292 RepID=UPI001D186BB5|nr:BspA family leucine-rich repeat surface protein [Muricauda sp. M10]